MPELQFDTQRVVIPPPDTSGCLRLTPSALALIFDFLSVDELLVASWICQSWRLAARSHPNYRRHVHLWHPSAGAVALFADRLGYISSEPLDVTVRLTDGVLSLALASNVILAIKLQLGRIRNLDIDFQAFPVDSRVVSALHGMLSTGAPHCRSLRLDACRSALRLQLPFRLFDNTASLRCAALGSIILPSQLPSTMCDTAALELVSDDAIDVGAVLMHVPGLSFLMLDAPALSRLELIPPMLPNLTKVCVHVDTDVDLERFLSCPALQLVPEIELHERANSAAFFAPLLQDDTEEIELLVERNPGARSFRAVFTCASKHVTRCLSRLPLHVYDADVFVPASESAASLAVLAPRISMAILPLEMLQCVGTWMGNKFPALRAVVLDMYAPQVPYSGRWTAPALEAIVLSGGDGRLASISPHDVDFMKNAVFGSGECSVFCTSGLRVADKAPLLCRIDDFAIFTCCFPTAA